MKTLEIESKLEITEEDFNTLKETGHILQFVDQLNIYFDERFELVNKAITFRIRLYRNRNPKMTLKIPLKKKSERREALEFEYDLSSNRKLSSMKEINVCQSLPKELKNEMEKLHINSLSRIGYMRTHRWKIKLPNDTFIELDKVKLPNGKNFFEVEIENENYSHHESAIRYIKQIVNNPKPSKISKFERFAEALKGNISDHITNNSF